MLVSNDVYMERWMGSIFRNETKIWANYDAIYMIWCHCKVIEREHKNSLACLFRMKNFPRKQTATNTTKYRDIVLEKVGSYKYVLDFVSWKVCSSLARTLTPSICFVSPCHLFLFRFLFSFLHLRLIFWYDYYMEDKKQTSMAIWIGKSKQERIFDAHT